VPERHSSSSRKPVLCLESSRHNWAVEEWQISLGTKEGCAVLRTGGGCTRNSGRRLPRPCGASGLGSASEEAQDGPALKVRPHLGSLNPDAPTQEIAARRDQTRKMDNSIGVYHWRLQSWNLEYFTLLASGQVPAMQVPEYYLTLTQGSNAERLPDSRLLQNSRACLLRPPETVWVHDFGVALAFGLFHIQRKRNHGQ
jgi:hypothetical protein